MDKKGIFLWDNSGIIVEKFPLKVFGLIPDRKISITLDDSRCLDCTNKSNFGLKWKPGQVWFKSKEAEKIEKEEIDKNVTISSPFGEKWKPSDLIFNRFMFILEGDKFPLEMNPSSIIVKIDDEILYLYEEHYITARVKKENGETINANIVPFSTEPYISWLSENENEAFHYDKFKENIMFIDQKERISKWL